MHTFSLTHLANATLLSNLTALVARERANTAELLAHLAEVESRRLYAPAGYPSMHDYCVEALHFSEQAAYKRIRAARAARRFPAIFAAVADGRLHLSAIVLLSGWLTETTASELLSAAENKSSSEIELLLAHRFPRPDLPARVQELAPSPPVTGQLSPGTVGTTLTDQLSSGSSVRLEVEQDQLVSRAGWFWLRKDRNFHADGPESTPILTHRSKTNSPA